MAKTLDPKTFPVDATRAFKPTKTYWLRSSSRFSTDGYAIFELATTAEFALRDGLLGEEAWTGIEKRAKEEVTKTTTPSFSAAKKGMLSTDWTVKDPTDSTLVTFDAKVSGFGKWEFAFPENSPHSTHPIELLPVGAHKKEKMFVMESVPFFWEMKWADKACVLYKVVDQKRVVVAEYQSVESGFKKNLMLVADDSEIDPVVVLATAVAMANMVHSFDKAR
jgi:hypothetical protein